MTNAILDVSKSCNNNMKAQWKNSASGFKVAIAIEKTGPEFWRKVRVCRINKRREHWLEAEDTTCAQSMSCVTGKGQRHLMWPVVESVGVATSKKLWFAEGKS